MPLVSALLVAAVSLEHLPMGGGLELVYCGLTKSSAALLGDDLAVLRSIQGNFQPIRAHFESARNSSGIAGFSFRKFESITIQLLQRRLLLDTAGFMECTSPGHPVKQPDPDLVDLVICTRDRPEALHRNIETCLQSSEMWGRQVNFLIIDDSHTEAGNRATETVLSAFTTGTAKPNFVLLGRDSRERASLRLSEELGISHRCLRFALCGATSVAKLTTGSARNAGLLFHAGRRCLMVDDDVVWKCFEPPDSGEKLIVSGWHPRTPQSYERDAFRTWEQVDRATGVPVDFLGRHSAVLGKPLLDMMLEALNDHQRLAFTLGPQCFQPGCEKRVLVSNLGFIGDCASDWTGHYLFDRTASIERLASHGQSALQCLESRLTQVWSPSTLISNGPMLHGVNIGIDNRQPMPPFFPIDYGEDALYHLQARACRRDYVCGALPGVILHKPIENRQQQDWYALEHSIRPLTVVQSFIQLDLPPAN